MIDDIQVSFPRYDLRATGNFSRVLDLHLLFASKVFAVEGRFMGSPRWNAPSTRGDRHCGANVETVNHSSLNARRRTRRRETFRTVAWRPISHVAAALFGPCPLQRKRLQQLGLSQAESSGILQELGRLQLYDGYRDEGRSNLGTRNRLLAVVAARDLRASCASASEPCESKRSTSWRSSIDDRKNIGWYRDKQSRGSQEQEL